VRTPFGKVNKISLALLALIVAAIVAGLLIPGTAGTVIEVSAWLAVVVIVLLEIGERTTPFLGNRYGDERRRR
jgi:hypothetical protein